MEDIRTLEMEQQEAKRKLKQAEMTKEHKLKQRESLEEQLGKLVYSNGALRAQIKQYREALSYGTRVLGARRLVTGRNNDEIKEFERRLKDGIKSTRIFMYCRRKIESAILVLESKTENLKRRPGITVS